jgi:hypothetical protein
MAAGAFVVLIAFIFSIVFDGKGTIFLANSAR